MSRHRDDARIIVRAAQRGELGELVEMICELAAFERMADQVLVRAVDLEKFLFCVPPRIWALMAWKGGKTTGYAMVSEHFSSFAGRFGLYLEDVYVRKGHRNTGVGRALLGQVGRLAAALGHDRLDFQVLDWNVQARAFYERIGARSLEGWVPYRLSGEALAAMADDVNEGGQR